MDIKCNTENWSDICDQLEKRRNEIIHEYDDSCFYMALSINQKAIDLIYWRCKSESQTLLADFLLDILGLYDGSYDERNVDFGFYDYTHLETYIRNNAIAHDLECCYDYLRFDVKELHAHQFPIINHKCLKNHLPDIGEKLYDIVMEGYDALEYAIEDIFKVFREHSNDCKEDIALNK